MQKKRQVSKYVILGNSTAAVSAVESIRKADPAGTITIVSSEPYHTYARPLISYYLSGQVKDSQLLYRPREFYQGQGVTALLGIKAIDLDAVNRRVFLESALTEDLPARNQALYRTSALSSEILEYDKLLLATGSRPAVPPIEGINQPGVHYFYTLDDVMSLKAVLVPNNSVVVLGAGLIGMKAAEALSKLGCSVTVVEMADRILGTILDSEAASLIQTWFEEHGVEFRLGIRASGIMGSDRVAGVVLEDGSLLKCGAVVVAVGVRPNLELIQNTTIKYQQGILVNEHQETSEAGVFCAGDVCAGWDRLFGQAKLTPILPNAYQQGRIAGMNMAGKTELFSGSVAFNSTTFFGLPVITMGFNQAQGEGVCCFKNRQDRDYRSLIFKDQQLQGAILINQTQRSGILLHLIREKLPVLQQKDLLLRGTIRLIDLGLSEL
jgi:NAD(P)H-nitrite reductase large subunit